MLQGIIDEYDRASIFHVTEHPISAIGPDNIPETETRRRFVKLPEATHIVCSGTEDKPALLQVVTPSRTVDALMKTALAPTATQVGEKLGVWGSDSTILTRADGNPKYIGKTVVRVVRPLS